MSVAKDYSVPEAQSTVCKREQSAYDDGNVESGSLKPFDLTADNAKRKCASRNSIPIRCAAAVLAVLVRSRMNIRWPGRSRLSVHTCTSGICGLAICGRAHGICGLAIVSGD